MGLSNAYAARIDTDGEKVGDLDRLIEIQRLVVARPDLDTVNERAVGAWAFLAGWLCRRAERGNSNPADLHRAVAAAERAVELTSVDHERYTDRLIGLVQVRRARLTTDKEQPDDRDRIVELHRLIAVRPDADDQASHFSALAAALVVRASRSSDTAIADIQEAVAVADTALTLTPERHPMHGIRLCNAANAQWLGYVNHLDTADIDRAIDLARQAVVLDSKLTENLYTPLRRPIQLK
jgi:hypothetical protein